ncbi:MAG: c-type cytochrome [Chitinophagaceae bacterium]|nr:c-type cytochrome [Bacteroidota bacterium]MBS1927823.1 c-type cytochrome [Bacteroidota bacterium]MCC6257280.1 c-type cytochrome [Chitinophagaceae bacterium]
MSLLSPAEGWYYKKVSKDEKMWMVIALVLCIMLFIWMVMWHVYGRQNPSSTTYKTSTAEFSKLSEAYIKQNMVGTDKGIPVVRPQPNSDVFILAEMWRWSPVLILQKDQAYKMHISSRDVLHGFSIQPVNMNFQVYPQYDYVLEFKPTEAGEYKVICNEFCGIGHHTMIGKMVVIEKEEDLKLYGYENFKKAPDLKSTKKPESLSETEMALQGEQVYALKGCAACHKTDGTSQLAPTWKGLYGKEEKVTENGKAVSIKVDDAYIKESIKNPQQKITVGFENTPMPVFPVSDEEIDQLIAYIKTLKN